jgi:hypothetical protein
MIRKRQKRSVTTITCVMLMLISVIAMTQPKMLNSKRFNEKAKEFFITNLHSLDLSPLSEPDKCVLLKTVSNELETLNDVTMTIIADDFVVRNYHEKYLDLHFSLAFDQISERFYFISLPQFEDFKMNVTKYYDQINDTTYRLKDPSGIMKLNTSLFDKLFSNDRFIVNLGNDDFSKAFDLASAMLSEMFRDLYQRKISVGEFSGALQDKYNGKGISKNDLNMVNELIQPMFTENNYRVQVFFWKEVGYVLFVYFMDQSQLKIKVDSYLIPNERRRMVYRQVDTKYRECISK